MKKLLAFVLIIALLLVQVTFADDIKSGIKLTKNTSMTTFLCSFNTEVYGEVILEAPNGNIYDKNSPEYSIEKKTIGFTITNPALGEWSFILRGIKEQDVNLTLMEYADVFHIDTLTVAAAENDTVKASYQIESGDGGYHIELYASQSKDSFNGVKVYEAAGGNSGEIVASIKTLSPGSYYFYIKATDQEGIDDYKYFDKLINVKSSTALPELSNIKVNVINHTFNLTWDPLEHSSLNFYKVLVYEQGGISPLYEEVISKDGELEYFSENLDTTKKLEVAVAGVSYEDVTGNYKRLPIQFNQLDNLRLDVQWPEGEYINSKRLLIPISFDKPNKVAVFHNDNFIKENIDQSGTYIIDLEDGQHKLGFVIEDPRGNIKSAEKTYYIDSSAPQITFFESYDEIKTVKQSIRIEGVTEAGARLLINDSEYQVGDEGYFDIQHKLKIGSNKLTIKAIDEAGNINMTEKVVIRNFDLAQLYPHMLLVAFLGVAVVLAYLYYTKK